MQHLLLAVVACALAIAPLLTLGQGVAPADPRPQVLVIAGANTLPFSHSPGWPEIVNAKLPELAIHVDASAMRTVGEVAPALETILAPYPRLDGVILFLGTNEARVAQFAKADAPALRKQVADLLTALKANARTNKAALIVLTPIPVVDARLDQFSKEAFSEKSSDAVAEAFRLGAADGGAAVIDVHAWSKAQVADGKPGQIVGSLGWGLRDWGHPILAGFVETELAKVSPRPADPVAMDQWRLQRQADRALDEILTNTGEATVAHGPALQSARKPLNKATVTTAEVPAEALSDESISFLVKAADQGIAVISPGSEIKQFPDNMPRLVVATDAGEVVIPSPSPDWQVIDEAEPEQAQNPEKYRANIVKMRYFGLASGEPNARKWMLIRFPLKTLVGRKITSASVILGQGPSIEGVKGQVGDITVHIVQGPDRQWNSWQSTWRSRDAGIRWTGGKPDPERRASAIEEFLKSNPPDATARRAKAALAN